MTRYPIATAVSDRLARAIQPRKSTDAPQHHPDVSLRGAKRRGNLAGPGPITGQPRRIRRLLREIATSAYGLLAMTNLGALHGRRWCTEIYGSAWRSRISMPLRERAEVRLARHEAGCAAVLPPRVICARIGLKIWIAEYRARYRNRPSMARCRGGACPSRR